MKCNQCGKEIPKTNTHSIIYNNTHMILCGKHYSQYIKFGHFLDSVSKSTHDSNEYEITPEGVWIYTFNSKEEPSGKFMVDLDDLEKVLSKKWRFWKGDYFTGNKKPVTISRFIMDATNENLVVDHINGDRTDNRRKNLRIVTQKNNLINKAILSNNTSEIAGVWWDKSREKWVAEIKLNNIKCQLGRYINKEDAVFVRYFAELKVFKEFRSNRNDQRIMLYVNACKNKEELSKYVLPKLQKKFNI